VNPDASHLVRRVLGLKAAFTLLVAALVTLLSPRLLLLGGTVATEGARALGVGLLAGGLVALISSGIRLRRHRFALRALALGSKAVEAHDLHALGEEPTRTLVAWLVPSAAGTVLATLPFAPKTLDTATGATLCLLGLALAGAVSLPLFVLLRSAFARALMLAPVEVMRDVVEDAERIGLIGRWIPHRMVVAVALPVGCLALGALLIVAGHVRRADERSREETARVISRAVLEPGPGADASAGIAEAVVQARALGFYAYSQREPAEYGVEHGERGQLIVTTPLDTGSASMEFPASTVAVLNAQALLVAVFGTLIAGMLGLWLGRILGEDLRAATADVRALGTESVIKGGRPLVHEARFPIVARLGLALARLTGLFRVFARAQERAIAARNAAARMRGLFFASVSHDLKSPLNAILGFTELVRRAQPVTPGQEESLDLIERRGRELLALIETILDAARVEAGQLTLVLDRVDLATVLEQTLLKARDLGGDRDVQAVVEIAPGIPPLRADRVRLPRALATFVAYAMREAESPTLRVVATPEAPDRIRLEVEVPNDRFNVAEIDAMLDPSRAPSAGAHRGLALALRLGRSIVELHQGAIALSKRPGGGAFVLHLPAGG
jgi:signal transduction histidine kinase